MAGSPLVNPFIFVNFVPKYVVIWGNVPIKHLRTMSQQELHSYRLTSMEEPTDEMLHAVMEQVAESARRSSAKAESYIKQQFERIRAL